MNGASRRVTLRNLTGEIRVGGSRLATLFGREQLVFPVVMLKAGVLQAVNAPSPELVLPSAYPTDPAECDGRPVMAGHPVDANGRQISANSPTVLEAASFGMIFNTRVAGDSLTCEAWIDPVRAMRVAERILRRLAEGQTVSVSVGAYVTVEAASGVYGGKRFASIWRSLVLDHLAFLGEAEQGACSIAMGCGVHT